ncbi:hypothetical protein, partial [Aeromonas caviae]|uniref:hypothetical protein n=1 Tax=Aeromonas caviae TaxID=648 RepID=UPI001CC45DA7
MRTPDQIAEKSESSIKSQGMIPPCLPWYPALHPKAMAREGANKRGNSSRLTQSFHFFMFEPIFSPVNALNQPI